jgi:hypothetical protein
VSLLGSVAEFDQPLRPAREGKCLPTNICAGAEGGLGGAGGGALAIVLVHVHGQGVMGLGGGICRQTRALGLKGMCEVPREVQKSGLSPGVR